MSKAAGIDILVVGGGLGGCAAALAAAGLGFRVVLTEETDWIGGQLTSQAVPPDEHSAIEECGCTRRYRQLRDGIRKYYRDHYPLTAAARDDQHFNPGGARVSRVAHEPHVALAVLEQMMAPLKASGALTVLLRRKPIAIDQDGDRVRSVAFRNLEDGQQEVLSAHFILDATELGELLPLGKIEYVSGAESRRETGEEHAIDGPAQPDNVQALTWCFPVAFDPDEAADHVIERPAQYGFWRDYVPPLKPAWPGRLLSWTYSSPVDLQPVTMPLFPMPGKEQDFSLWRYRRILATENFAFGRVAHDVSIVNWPQNDYVQGSIIDKPEAEVAKHLEGAKQLSLSLLYWLQTEAPRPDGRQGYPGLQLRPDMTGTLDGLAKAPYIRESRRIKALFTIVEGYLSPNGHSSRIAESLPDSVGIGSYQIDLHPSTGGDNYLDYRARMFQIPLGALIPVRMRNLIPACKNIGTTHISNGCYRLHPVEWNIGEASGILAAFCLSRHAEPRAIHEDASALGEYQALLKKQGIELHWPDASRS